MPVASCAKRSPERSDDEALLLPVGSVDCVPERLEIGFCAISHLSRKIDQLGAEDSSGIVSLCIKAIDFISAVQHRLLNAVEFREALRKAPVALEPLVVARLRVRSRVAGKPLREVAGQASRCVLERLERLIEPTG